MPRGGGLKSVTQTKYYPFNGGLDVVTPALSVDPGFCLAMVNYEPYYNGGYRRIDGYERFDGHSKPSLGTAYGFQVSSLSGITGVGTLTSTSATNVYQPGTGVTSGATAIVVAAITTYTQTVQITGTLTTTGTATQYWLAITRVAGTFATAEKMYIGTTTMTATIVTTPSANYGPGGTGTDGFLYTSEFEFGAQNYYRQQILVVPGTGNILGVWQNGSNVYAVRGTSTNTGTPAVMWLSTSTNGWGTSALTYANTLYYGTLALNTAIFTAQINQNGYMIVGTMTAGTLAAGMTVSDTTGLVPIGATITNQLPGGVAGGTGTYQLSVIPSIPVPVEGMFACNDTATLPIAGQTVTGVTSGAVGTVAYVIPQDTAVGYIAFSKVTGTFSNAESLTAGGTGFANAVGTNVLFALPGGTQGFYRWQNQNFYAGTAQYNAYGCNGVGPAFQIDNAQLITPILMPLIALTNQPPANNPFLLCAYQGFLFLAFPGGIYQQSVAGSPLQFDGFLGAEEFSVGDTITGLFSMVGPNLIIPTKHSSWALSGNSDANFVQSLVAEKAGAILYSGQLLDTVYAINNLGITSLSRTQSYGNYVGATVSQLIQPMINALRPNFNDSTIVREFNEARFYFNDGSCLIMYVPGLGQQNKAWSAIESGVTAQFGYASYPSPIFNICNSEDQNNNEVGYFGLSNGDGYVYQDRSGQSFDGIAITSYIRLAFNNVGSPAVRKYFRRADLELNSPAQVMLKFAADLTYSNEESASSLQFLTAANIPAVEVFGGGGYWDSVNWNQFYWDGQAISTARAQLDGTGLNISFLIFHQAVVDLPFVLQGLTLYYDPRRNQR